MITREMQISEQYILSFSTPTIKYRNVYVAAVSFMSGDADVYETEEWRLETHEEVIKFLDAVPGFYQLKKVWGWTLADANMEVRKYFDILTEDEYSYEKLHNDGDDQEYDVQYSDNYNHYLKSVEIDWPRDKSCEDCGDAAFNGYTLYWYDNEGKESVVTVQTNKVAE